VVDEMPDSVAELRPPDGEQRGSSGRIGSIKAVSVSGGKKKMDLPAGAIKADLPHSLSPELATLVDEPPVDSAEWVYEIKLDGYRVLARIDDKGVRLFTRNGNDWSHNRGVERKRHTGLSGVAECLRQCTYPEYGLLPLRCAIL
jgi:bifunctional non-homologous end joining protein LigD